MADEERIFQLLAQIAADQAELKRDINGINTLMRISEMNIESLKTGYETVRADVTRVQLDMEKMRDTQYNMVEHVDALRGSVGKLENNIMHELHLLNENLPDVIERREQVMELAAAMDDHSHRIFALEQVVGK